MSPNKVLDPIKENPSAFQSVTQGTNMTFARFIAALFISALLAPPLAGADAASDKALGDRYIHCGQVVIAVNQAGGASQEAIVKGPGPLMTALGAELLNVTSVETLKPHLEAARARIADDAKAKDASLRLFEAYSGCIALHNKESPGLVERFKERMAARVRAPKGP